MTTSLRALALAAMLALVPSAALPAITQFDFDVSRWHVYMNDFDVYTVGDWTLTTTEAGAGSATEALTSVDGGGLLVTNDAADNDLDFFQLPSEGFKFESGKRLFFKARFKILEVLQSDFVIGLQITDTTMLDVTDGIFFQKDDGDALLDLRVEKNNTATATTGVATLVADTFITVAFYYDPGESVIKYYINDELAGSSVITNVVDDEELTVSFGLQNGEAVVNTMTIDYVLAAKQR